MRVKHAALDKVKLGVIRKALEGKPIPKQRTITGVFVIMLTNDKYEGDQVIEANGVKYRPEEFMRIVEEERKIDDDEPNILFFKVDRDCYPVGADPEHRIAQINEGRPEKELITDAWSRFDKGHEQLLITQPKRLEYYTRDSMMEEFHHREVVRKRALTIAELRQARMERERQAMIRAIPGYDYLICIND